MPRKCDRKVPKFKETKNILDDDIAKSPPFLTSYYSTSKVKNSPVSFKCVPNEILKNRSVNPVFKNKVLVLDLSRMSKKSDL